MHESVMIWAGEKIEKYGLADCDTLEVGSLNVNGSVRGFFRGPSSGSTCSSGPGVDIVALASAIPFEDERFELVISTEMLEHDPAPWLSMPQMGRVLKRGGHLLRRRQATAGRCTVIPTTTGGSCPRPATSCSNWLAAIRSSRRERTTGGTGFCCMAPSDDPRHHRSGAERTELLLECWPRSTTRSARSSSSTTATSRQLDKIHAPTTCRGYRVIQPGHNLGVAASWNLGIKATPLADWWLICNSDIKFGPGDLAKWDAE